MSFGRSGYSRRLAYLDGSAYVKLPLREAEQEALLLELSKWDGYVSSALLGVEAVRACARYGEEYAADARSFLLDMSLLRLGDEVSTEAGIGCHTAELIPGVVRCPALNDRWK